MALEFECDISYFERKARDRRRRVEKNEKK